MQPLDFVLTPLGAIALVSEVNEPQQPGMKRQASITFIGPSKGEHNAWWSEDELQVIDSLPRILAVGLCHPFGAGKPVARNSFPLPNKSKMQ